MAYPSSREWHHNHYHRIIKGFGWDYVASYVHRTNLNSVADRYQCSPIIVPVRCRIDRIGVWLGDATDGGDVIFALHDSDGGLLPNALVCQTVAVACAPLQVSVFHWFTPTTTPIIEPGYYYVGHIAEETYNPGIAGLRWAVVSVTSVAGTNTWNDALTARFRQDVGSFTVPNPMVEVVDDEDEVTLVALRVTVML